MSFKGKRKGPIIYLCITAFWGLLYFRIPLIHDAWASRGVYNAAGGFVNWVKDCFSLYNTLNGRTLATIVVGFFERNEFVLDIVCILTLTAIVFLYQKCLRSCNAIYALYGVLAILAVPIGVRTEVYFYATMIYILPVLYITVFALCLERYILLNKFESLKQYVIFLIVGYANAAWIEHISCAFVASFAVFVIYDTVKNKKINIRLCTAELIFCTGFLIMMMSPGLRLQRNFSLENQSTLMIIRVNLNLLIRYLFVEHSGMLSLFIIACIIFAFLYKERFKSHLFRNLYILTMFFWLVFMMKNLWTQSIPLITPKIGSLLLILLFGELMLPITKSKFKITLFSFYFTGLMSLAPVIITPNLSYRVCHYFFVMLNFIVVAIWIENLLVLHKWKNPITFSLLIPTFIVADIYCTVTYSIYTIQAERETLINETVNLQHKGLWNYDDVLVLPRFGSDQLYADASPEKYYDRIHYQVFLDYYHLHPNTLVYFGDSYDRLKAIENENHSVILYAEPAQNNVPYSFQFQMLNNNVVVDESSVTNENNYKFTVPDNVGSYYFRCVITDGSGNEIHVFSPKVIDIE